jgi:hypothetical protein
MIASFRNKLLCAFFIVGNRTELKRLEPICAVAVVPWSRKCLQEERVFMKTIASACFGFALAISAFALSGAPASALEAPAPAITAPNNTVKVGEREERERCERVRRECRERHGDRDREYRECVEREHCER